MAAEGAKERSRIPLKKKFQRKKTFTEALKEKYLGDDEQEECNGFVIQFVSGKQKQGSAELGFLKNVVCIYSKNIRKKLMMLFLFPCVLLIIFSLFFLLTMVMLGHSEDTWPFVVFVTLF